MTESSSSTQQLDPELASAVVEQMDEAICLLDDAGVIRYANSAAVALLGQKAEALRGRLLFDEVLRRGTGTAALQEALRAGRILRECETAVRVSEHTERPLAVDIWPMSTPSKVPTVAVLLRDISRRQGTERKLRRRVDELQAIVSGAGLAILVMTLEGEIAFGNHACADVFGTPAEGLAGKRLIDLLVEADRPVVASHLQQLARNEVTHLQRECRWKRLDGDSLWGNLTASLLRHADGSPRLILAIIEDINPRKQVEAELQEVKRRLARSRERVQQRLAQELHDGPIQDLYAAQYQLQALDHRLESEREQQLLDTTHGILKQVSNTLRAIMGELRPPALAPFGLHAALHSLADQFTERFPDLQVTREIDDGEPQLPQHVRLTLYRIAQEMLNNVAQHADAAHVLIRFEAGRNNLLLEVQDDGAGFEVPARWIELARRDHLGLVGIAERVEEIDGQLTILSAPQQGTIVRVVTPRAAAP